MTGWLRVAVVLLVTAGAAVVGFATTIPPSARPASAATDRFSAERALAPLATLARRPHPTGTPAAGEVRRAIIEELTRLGLEVTVQDTTSVNARYASHGYPVVAGHVRNVIARRAGTAGPPAVLLAAHYDSRELAPGASDDGYGTAVLLEAARALSAGRPLRHDVILLFTEGEEQGLLGAKAFVEESPVARDVAVAINVDCRGDRGAGLMFQTSDRSAELVETLARASSHVNAASLSQEVYRRMPNDTDLTEFLRAGRAGVNLGNIDGFERYHQSTDTPANADPRTVQQLGDDALGLVKDLADREALPVPATHDDVYFNAGPLFVVYDARAALPLSLLCVAGLVAGALVARRRGLVTARGVLAGAVAAVLVPLLAGLAGLALVLVAGHVRDALTTQTLCDRVRKECFVAFLLLGAGIAWACGSALVRRISTLSLLAGAALPASVLALVTAAAIPGASFACLWPALAAGAALVLRAARPSLPSDHPLVLVTAAVGPAVACVVLVPLAWQVGLAFGVSAAPVLAAIAAIAVLSAPACVGVPARAPLRAVSGALVAAGLGLLGVALGTPPHDADAPAPDSLFLAVDADAQRSWWVSVDEHPDRWTSQVLARDEHVVLPAFFPRQAGRPFLAEPAGPGVATRAVVQVQADDRTGASRRVRFHVAVDPGTEALELLVPPAAHVSGALVQGHAFGPVGDGWLDLAFAGPPEDGLDLELTASPGPLELTLVCQSRGLPLTGQVHLTPRPPELMPEVAGPMRSSDMTLVSSAFRL